MSGKKRRLKRGTNPKAKRHVSTKPLPWNGDHGTGTAAAVLDTRIEPIEGSPNRMANRRRLDRVRELLPHLTLRQHQAAAEIQNAYACLDMLSSGSPLKERVQSSPKPDATISAQVDAQSRLELAVRGVLRADKALVEDICWHNRPWLTIKHRHGYLAVKRFIKAMDRAADFFRY